MADVLHLLRVTIEAVSPISSASGGTGDYDVVLARDANGLPEIAGASLQGVLRHLYEEVYKNRTDLPPANDLFGFAEGAEGAAARLVFGFGRPHDSNDIAVVGRLAAAPEFADELLRMLSAEAPLQRDHVALSDRHVPQGRAKFERVAVPRGTRFSFEIAMGGKSGVDKDDEKQALLALLSLFGHPAFRVGGGARRGYGKVKLRRAGYRALPLARPLEIREVRRQAPSDHTDFDSVIKNANLDAAAAAASVTLNLSPVGLWRVGSTGDPLRTGAHELRDGQTINRTRGDPDRREKDADAAPLREPAIVWADGVGKWDEPRRLVDGRQDDPSAKVAFTIPGTAIKGPLAHRAVFHWNRLNRHLIDPAHPPDDKTLKAWRQRTEELEALFGLAKERGDGNTKGRGRAARLIVDDATVELARANSVGALDHNSIDRFTGGVRNRLLYSEEAVLGGAFEVSMTILPPLPDADGKGGSWQDQLAEAFCCALADLIDGRLALGAKSLGFCKANGAEGGRPKFNGDTAVWERAWAKVEADRANNRGAAA